MHDVSVSNLCVYGSLLCLDNARFLNWTAGVLRLVRT